MNNNFAVSASPHIVTNRNTSRIMLDVIIAMIPAAIGAVYFFGVRALMLILTCVVTAVAFEAIFCVIVKKPVKATVMDFSAVITGMLLAFNLPVSLPLWMAALGSGFAIIIVKQLFGGIGANFVNPALAARAFLMASFMGAMTSFTVPFASLSFFGALPDAVSTATLLPVLREGGVTEGIPSLMNAFTGNIAGCLGETSSLLLLLGGIYLVIRKVITVKIPLVFIGTFAILTFLFGKTQFDVEFTAYQIFSGGLMLGAIFMATDYTTSPTGKLGQIVFGFGCGALTFLIRNFGGYPEGVSYAILLMNVVSPLIEKYIVPKPFGYVKPAKDGGAR